MNKDEFIENISSITDLSKEMATEGTLIVMSLFSHRLTPEEAKDVTAQLPKGVKDLWHGDTWATEHMHISQQQQLDYKKAAELYSLVQNEIDKRGLPVGAEVLVKAVLGTLKDQISEGEAEDIAAQLPSEIQEIWEQA